MSTLPTNVNWDKIRRMQQQRHTNLFWRAWAKFGDKKTSGEGHDPAKKLAAILKLSEIVVENDMPAEVRRANFMKIKHKAHPFTTYPKCFICGDHATARHHIILLKNGGSNDRKNIVSLCAPCHAKIHPWLDEDQLAEESL